MITPPSFDALPELPEPGSEQILPAPSSGRERLAELAIIRLYASFFLLWTAGLCAGLFADAETLFLGLPLWFVISAIFSYIVICAALALTVRRYFR